MAWCLTKHRVFDLYLCSRNTDIVWTVGMDRKEFYESIKIIKLAERQVVIELQRAGWSSCNDRNSYSGGAKFEYRLGHQLSWLRFLLFSSDLRGKC
jgi:hypothetical protein